MKIYIARHGQDDDSVRGGWSDCSLTECRNCIRNRGIICDTFRNYKS